MGLFPQGPVSTQAVSQTAYVSDKNYIFIWNKSGEISYYARLLIMTEAKKTFFFSEIGLFKI